MHDFYFLRALVNSNLSTQTPIDEQQVLAFGVGQLSEADGAVALKHEGLSSFDYSLSGISVLYRPICDFSAD